MLLPMLAQESKKKGVHLIGTGDCLHPTWLSEIKQMPKIDEGTFELNGARFILTTEVEDAKRVHHLIMFPSVSSVEDFIKKLDKKHSALDSDGRPRVHMLGEELAGYAKDVDALIGPCHAFTPWTGMYGAYNSISECYGTMTDYISFVELGLSADSSYADRIEEIRRCTYLTNSDAHSPYPSKLAREFNRLDMNDATFYEVKKAILRQGGRKFALNVGMPPEEGKYNRTACIKCTNQYSLPEAVKRKWKCECGGRLKKGVRERVEEIATYPKAHPPEHRPKYVHIIPLSEIIGKAFDAAPTTKVVVAEWDKLISRFGNEVAILIDEPIEEVAAIADTRVAWAIECFRNGTIILHPGGGGRFGTIDIPSKNGMQVNAYATSPSLQGSPITTIKNAEDEKERSEDDEENPPVEAKKEEVQLKVVKSSESKPKKRKLGQSKLLDF